MKDNIRDKQLIPYDISNIGINEITNENNWLYRSEEHPITKSLMLYRDTYNISAYKDILNNVDRILEYEKFMRIAADIVKDISIPNNSISSGKVIMELINKGYLSKDGKFTRGNQIKQYFDIPTYSGIDVVNGSGVCRHTSSILKDIFKNLGLYNGSFPCHFDYDFISIIEAYNMDTNHAINIIEYEGRQYGCDTFNQEFYYFLASSTMRCYESDSFLYYKPAADILINNASYQKVLNKLELYSTNASKGHISKESLDEIINETMDRMDQKKNILQDFREEAKEYTKKITSTQ